MRLKNKLLLASELFLKSNFLIYFLIFLLTLKILSIGWFFLPKEIFLADITKTALIELINKERQMMGLNPLKENEKLNQAAFLKAQNMIENNYFSHISPSGINPWFWFSKVGYDYKYAGENLAVGFIESLEVFQAWMNSYSHRMNILNPNYQDVGIAVVKGFGENNAFLVVQLLGTPKTYSSPATIINTPQKEKEIIKTENSDQQAESLLTEKSRSEEKSEVLPLLTKNQMVLGKDEEKGKSTWYFKFLNYLFYNYQKIFQYLTYSVSVLVIGSLGMIALSPQISFNKNFVYRISFIIILLSLSILANREIILSLIPHQLII